MLRIVAAPAAAGEQATMLMEYPRADFAPALSDDIDSVICEHAEAVDKWELQFALIYANAEGTACGTRVVNFRRPRTVDPLEQAGQVFSGTDDNRMIQMQRHVEGMMKLSLQAQQAGQQQLIQIVQLIGEQNVSLLSELATARDELYHWRISGVEAAEAAASGEDDGGAATRATNKFIELAERFAPMLLAQAMARGAGGTGADGTPGGTKPTGGT